MPLDYHAPQARNSTAHRFGWAVRSDLWLSAAVVSAIFAVGFFWLTLSGGGTREPRNRATCVSNLTTIGQAIRQYAAAHGDLLPHSLYVLAVDQSLRPATFVCPSGNAEQISATTMPVDDAGRAAFESRSHPQYRGYDYAVPSATPWFFSRLQPRTVLVLDTAYNHDSDGMNVLYADGTVGWVSDRDPRKPGQAARLDADFAAGVWPLLVR